MFKHILSLFLKVSGAVMHTLILYEMGVINVLKIMLLLNDKDLKPDHLIPKSVHFPLCHAASAM